VLLFWFFQNNNARHSRSAYHSGIIHTNVGLAIVIRESLNAAQAATIFLFEYVRRTFAKQAL